MSLTFGFYNSQNKDRRYNANQMSSLFDGIIKDGIFEAIGDKLMVSKGSGMTVNVGTGRAWFNQTWTYNDADMLITVDASERLLNRIDTIVIDGNKLARTNSIVIVKGTPATEPIAPTLSNDADAQHYQHPLCDIYVGAGVTEITQDNIKNRVGVDCPFVIGAVQSVTIDALVAQWKAQWEEWSEAKYEEVNEWFNGVRGILAGDAAANLANRILELEDDNAKHKALFECPEMHRNIFRGKYLGNRITDTQLTNIRNGSFEDLYVGDYWTIPYEVYNRGSKKPIPTNWRIADINYWLNRGDTKCTTQHLVIIPDDVLVADTSNLAPVETNSSIMYLMENTNNTSYGYGRSLWRTYLKSKCYNPIIATIFGSMILEHREYLTTEVCQKSTDVAFYGYPSKGEWFDCNYESPSEIMIYGCNIFAAVGNGSVDVKSHTVSTTQLALFRLHPESILVPDEKEYWLRDVVNTSRYAFVSKNGEASYGNAASVKGYRPVFAIG